MYRGSIIKIVGHVFTKGLSLSLGLNVPYKSIKFKPKLWLSPFVNTGPETHYGAVY